MFVLQVGEMKPMPENEVADFIESHARQIKGVAGSVLRSGNCTDPGGHRDEVFQEVCLKLWQSWSTLRSPDAALNTITAHAAHSHARTCRREFANGDIEEGGDPCFQPAAADPADFYESSQFVRQLLERLDPVDQAIMKLHWFSGFTFDEVGTILGMPSATVRSRHSRAIALLNELMDDIN
jgi:RNA polymerase sigma factor (sigma-70 family)